MKTMNDKLPWKITDEGFGYAVFDEPSEPVSDLLQAAAHFLRSISDNPDARRAVADACPQASENLYAAIALAKATATPSPAGQRNTNTMTREEANKICQEFANKHKVIFDDEGECGFGRECVGFREDGAWIDHNPCTSGGDYEKIAGLDCPDAYAPSDVNSYHKHDCLAVLGRGDEAVIGLAQWVQNMESAGEVKLVWYETGATGLQALMSGVRRRAISITPRAKPGNETL